MSGVCPVPAVKQQTDFSTVGTFGVQAPDARYNECSPAQNQNVNTPSAPVTTQVCCPSPGPQGPAGADGTDGACGAGFEAVGDWAASTSYSAANPPTTCNADVVYYQGGAYACIQDHTSDSGSPAVNTPGVGSSWETYWARLWQEQGAGSVTWRGFWQDGVSYEEDDFITDNEGDSYICTVAHTSDSTNRPDVEFDVQPGGSYWILVSRGGMPQEEQSLFDNLVDGVFDWIGDIDNWGLGDWVTALAAGAGLIWAGNALNDMFEYDGNDGPTPADSKNEGPDCIVDLLVPPTLQDAVESVCLWAGVASYDVSALPTTQVHFTIGSITSARAILRMLSDVYSFDAVDRAGTLVFVPRAVTGSPPYVKQLTQEVDLGWTRDGDAIPVPYSIKRYQGIDLPRSVSITYNSLAAGHNKMTQNVTLETYTEGQDIQLQVPVTLTEQEAQEIVERTMVTAHVERMVYSFTTNWNHIDLEPGDVIEVDTLGLLRILRIDEQQEYGLLDIQAVDATFGNSYAPSGLTPQSPEPYTDSPLLIGFSAGLILELPPSKESDKDNPHLTLVPHGFNVPGWAGCAIYVSVDGGASYDLWGNASQESTWGRVEVAAAAPPSDSPWVWDETTVIEVELKSGTLESATKAEVYNGKNYCLIGEEVLAFRTATFTTGDTYELSGLLRGRQGTEVKMGSHVADEAFVLLNDALIEFPYDIGTKELERQFKFVTFGSDISKATAYAGQPNTVSIRPWKVSDLEAVQNGNDWDISWTARNQFEGALVDSGPVPNPFKFGGFVIQIVDPGSPEVVMRTITQQLDYVTYTEAQQIADFGSAQTSITVRVSQIDQRIGPGYDNTQTF